MDFKLFYSTFLAIFLAEMGDKTQIATLSLAAGARSRWAVFVGAASGLILTSALAVVGGDVISPICISDLASTRCGPDVSSIRCTLPVWCR